MIEGYYFSKLLFFINVFKLKLNSCYVVLELIVWMLEIINYYCYKKYCLIFKDVDNVCYL